MRRQLEANVALGRPTQVQDFIDVRTRVIRCPERPHERRHVLEILNGTEADCALFIDAVVPDRVEPDDQADLAPRTDARGDQGAIVVGVRESLGESHRPERACLAS